MKGRVLNIEFDVVILVSRPELLQTIECRLFKWLPWEAPNVFG